MASLAINDLDSERVLALAGRLDAAARCASSGSGGSAVRSPSTRRLSTSATARHRVARGPDEATAKGEVTISRLKPAFAALLAQFDVEVLAKVEMEPPDRRRSRRSGSSRRASPAISTAGRVRGRNHRALAVAARHPSSVRWKDVWAICERVGADALPIVALISFLLVLAFWRSRCASSARKSSSPT